MFSSWKFGWHTVYAQKNTLCPFIRGIRNWSGFGLPISVVQNWWWPSEWHHTPSMSWGLVPHTTTIMWWPFEILELFELFLPNTRQYQAQSFSGSCLRIILFRNSRFCWKPGVSGPFHRNPLKIWILRGVSAGQCTNIHILGWSYGVI